MLLLLLGAGIVLKMAGLIKDGSRGQKNTSDGVNKPPSKTLIIPAKEFVQVIAKVFLFHYLSDYSLSCKLKICFLSWRSSGSINSKTREAYCRNGNVRNPNLVAKFLNI